MSEDILKSLNINRQDLIHLSEDYGLKRLALFGSCVRREEIAGSDVDFLVRWDETKPMTLARAYGVRKKLAELTGRDVDVVSEKSLHWYIRDQVLSEAEDLLS